MGRWCESSVRRWSHGAGEPPSDGWRLHADDVPSGQRHGRTKGRGWLLPVLCCAPSGLLTSSMAPFGVSAHQTSSVGSSLCGFGAVWQPAAWSRCRPWTLPLEKVRCELSHCIQPRLTQGEADLPAGNHVLDFFLSPRALVQLMPTLLRPAQV